MYSTNLARKPQTSLSYSCIHVRGFVCCKKNLAARLKEEKNIYSVKLGCKNGDWLEKIWLAYWKEKYIMCYTLAVKMALRLLKMSSAYTLGKMLK